MNQVVSSIVLLGGLGTALYLYVNGRQSEAGAITTATLLIYTFVL